MENQQLPQLYQKPLALNIETHAALTIGPSPNGYRFAATVQTCLLGLEQNENLFVDAAGAWQAAYIPAYIRRYPFITTDEQEGRFTVCFDEAFDGFNQEGGAPLFAEGQPTQKLQEIQAFLQDYLQQLKQTEQLGATLAAAGLFKQVDLQANLPDGRNFNLNGLLIVDEQQLAQLPDSDIVKLFRSGALALIHAHLLSLRTLSSLIELKTAAG